MTTLLKLQYFGLFWTHSKTQCRRRTTHLIKK